MGKEVLMPWRETCAMEERLKLLLEWDGGDISVSELCRHYGISRKTGYKWLHRYRSEGAGGLSDRSRAPLHHPQASCLKELERWCLLQTYTRLYRPTMIAWVRRQHP